MRSTGIGRTIAVGLELKVGVGNPETRLGSQLGWTEGNGPVCIPGGQGVIGGRGSVPGGGQGIENKLNFNN